MQPRTLKRAAGIFGTLLLIWLTAPVALRYTQRDPRLWPDAGKASRLLFTEAGGEISLIRKAGLWEVEKPFPHPADQDIVTDFLKRLEKMESSHPISTDPGRHESFLLTSSTSVRFRGYSGTRSQPEVDLFIGRPAADFDSFFIRVPNEDAVREAQGMPRTEFQRTVPQWADRVLCAVDRLRLFKIVLRTQKSTTVLSQKEGVWTKEGAQVPLSESALKASLEPILLALTRLEADRVMPVKDVHPFVLNGLKNPVLSLEITYLGANPDPSPEMTLSLEIGSRKPGFDHPIRRSGRPDVIYEAAEWRLKDVLAVDPREL